MKLVSLFLLLAGAGATDAFTAGGGALAFDVTDSPLWARWSYGSAYLYHAPCWCVC